MGSHSLTSGPLAVRVGDDGLISVEVAGWPGLRMGDADAAVVLGTGEARLVRRTVSRSAPPAVEITDECDPGPVVCRRVVGPVGDSAVAIESTLTNVSAADVELADVQLIRCGSGLWLGQRPEAVRVYEQGGYWSRVRDLGGTTVGGAASGEQDKAQAPAASSSQNVWLAYDAEARMALLVGFETGERWTGHIRTEGTPGHMPSLWSAGFDGGRTLIAAGAVRPLESLSIAAGPDPWRLLCDYGDRVRKRHGLAFTDGPPVSWCAWYPYRLGVSDERATRTARIAAERLKPLGLGIVELDLGWQKAYLPSAFEENDQFPRGLGALAEDLRRMGFLLGAWCAPFTISAHDPLAAEHPEWLLGLEPPAGEDRKPHPTGEWFWEPHGQTYALDLTHPGARAWLRDRMRSLARRGVRYLKPDFIGGASAGHLTGRHDRTVVAGGGAEAARMGMAIMREEIIGHRDDALVLNCGGPELPGRGAFPLLYTCEDTGNTGYVGWRHLKNDYGRNVAGHLWKNRRWGILQPSCMVVGLPGGIEEARLRATATFLAGGQVDIGDDLTTLPEDRWEVLQATLPPLGISATPVDLFEPFESASLAYDGSASGRGGDTQGRAAADHSRVWTVNVDGGWDAWTLVGLFNYDTNDDVEYGKAQITRFRLPPARLGLDPATDYSAFEFWSGQYLGASPFRRENPHGYRHPGDAQALISEVEDGRWEVSFFGPGVKLIVIRRARPHPWPVGTTFHQSGGTEIADVRWSGSVLRGTLKRPAGQSGRLIITPAGLSPREVRVGRRRAPHRSAANGSVAIPIVTEADATPWEVRF